MKYSEVENIILNLIENFEIKMYAHLTRDAFK